jgi:hypothetical protein
LNIKSMESKRYVFLEMLDVLSKTYQQVEPVSLTMIVAKKNLRFCSLYINGEAHGPDRLTTSIAHENVQGWRYHFY